MKNSNLTSALSECISTCNYCAEQCLTQEDANKMKECILTDLDCADYCTMMVKIINRDSEFVADLIRPGIRVIKACRDECKKHPSEHCRICAESCETALDACEVFLQKQA